jgi:hypothetical protein
MHRATVKVSAPNIDKLELCRELATNPSFVWVDQESLTIEFTFEFPDHPEHLLEQTMGAFDIVSMEESPQFEGVDIVSINEYPEAK